MSRQGAFRWCQGQRPAAAAKIKRSASPDRFSWRPGERVDGPPRRRAQDTVKDQTAVESARPPDGR